MFFLHEFAGRYPVGATTFVTPVRLPRIIGSAKLPDSQPALRLEEVAFTAYYPAETTSKSTCKGLHWVTR